MSLPRYEGDANSKDSINPLRILSYTVPPGKTEREGKGGGARCMMVDYEGAVPPNLIL